MHNSPTQARRDGPRTPALKERRLPPDHSARARLRWLRGLVLRPFSLRWQRGPRLVWVERRRADDAELTRARADLHAAMLGVDEAAQQLQELLRVDECLAEAGWRGIDDLPATTLERARLQAQLLAEECGSAALAGLAQRLQTSKPDAAATAPRDHAPPPGAEASSVEVSELGEDDYAQAERVWASSQPATLASPPAPPDVKA